MNKVATLGFAAVLFIAHNEPKRQYTQQSEEIEIYKESLEAYENKEWESFVTFYADTAIIIHNIIESKGIDISEVLQKNKRDEAIFSRWRFIDRYSQFEMVVTDDGKTWVNFRGVREGVLKANNKKYMVPTQINIEFVEGKIVKEIGYWDFSAIAIELEVINESRNLVFNRSLGPVCRSIFPSEF